jgi:REP element-mobilizing transposase RayT
MHAGNDRGHRKSIRLRGFDYAGCGGYFVTFCTLRRARLFGRVCHGSLQLTRFGRCAERCWLAIPDHFATVTLDAFVVMPDHVHAILWIARRRDDAPDQDATSPHGTPPGTIGSIIRGFKIGVTKWAHANTAIDRVWQRNYYEAVIRSPVAADRIRRYIANNPARWVAAIARNHRGNRDVSHGSLSRPGSVGAKDLSPLQPPR